MKHKKRKNLEEEKIRLLKKLTKEIKDVKENSQILLNIMKDVQENFRNGDKKIETIEDGGDDKRIDSPSFTREEAKKMARIAREIARRNGKKITMSMFFIENLK